MDVEKIILNSGEMSCDFEQLVNEVGTAVSNAADITGKILELLSDTGAVEYALNIVNNPDLSNPLAGGTVNLFETYVNQYSDIIAGITSLLDGQDLSEPDLMAQMWQRISPLNDQFNTLATAINLALTPPEPAPDPEPPIDPPPPTEPDVNEPGAAASNAASGAGNVLDPGTTATSGASSPGDPEGASVPRTDGAGDAATAEPAGSPLARTTPFAALLGKVTLDLSHAWDSATVIELWVPPTFGPTAPGDQLWIRVYPDEIFVNTFEPDLTVPEVTAGTAYWTSSWYAYGDSSVLLGAWSGLVEFAGAERAGWIREAMTPINIQSADMSPVFGLMDHLGLLTSYSGALLDLSANGSSVEADHLEFFLPQLNKLNETAGSISELPQENHQNLSDAVELSYNKFQEVASLGNIALNVQRADSIGGFVETFSKISASFSDLRTTVGSISLVDSWSSIYTTTPAFSTTSTVDSNWTAPARANVMPDRFLFAALRNSTNNVDSYMFGSFIFKHIAIGQKIPNPLITGINPTVSNITLNTTSHTLAFDDNIKWIFDFQNAIQKGMAIAFSLDSEELANGFDRVLALGMKLGEDESKGGYSTWADYLQATGKSLLETLLHDHHYTKGGMSLLEIGTPTNNTDDATSGFNLKDANNTLSYSTTTGGALFTATADITLKKDGQWLSDALGIDYSVLSHVQNADKLQIRNAISINRALWGGTIGNYMREMMNTLFTDDNVTRTKNYFTDYVLGRGALPSIRIKQQPYGILPVTSFGRWDWVSNYNTATPFPSGLMTPSGLVTPPGGPNKIGTYNLWDYATDPMTDVNGGIGSAQINNFLQDRYNIKITKTLELLNKVFIQVAAWNTKTVDKSALGSTGQADFMHMLGTDALMAEAEARYFINGRRFTYDHYLASGQGRYPMMSPPSGSPPTVATNLADIMTDFKALFNNYLFPLPSTTAPNSLGDPAGLGLFDTTDFLDYIAAYASIAMADPDSTPANPVPKPRYDWLHNALRMFNINFIDSPLPYKLFGTVAADKPLSKTLGLPAVVSSSNYIQWLNSNSTTLTDIWHDNVFSTMPSRSLLFLLLRQSLLTTYRESTFDILEGLKRSMDPIIAPSPIFNKTARKIIGTPESIALEQYTSTIRNYFGLPLNKWYFLFHSMDELMTSYSITDRYASPPSTAVYDYFGWLGTFFQQFFGTDTDAAYASTIRNGELPGYTSADPRKNILPIGTGAYSWSNVNLGNYLKNPPGTLNPDIEARFDWTDVNRLKSSLNILGGLPTAELDNLLREHVDLCTYRLDAWNYGMVNKRLWELRNTDTKDPGPLPSRKTGIYLGAYGWLLNVRPSTPGGAPIVSPSIIPSALATTGNVYYDTKNLGFIHTPSIAHALTAAVLRGGYRSENGMSPTDNRFAVNLSSERVSLAKSLLEGVRNGQSLNALLGYIFERNLHDRYFSTTDPTEMDKYIYYLRGQFPLTDTSNISNNLHLTGTDRTTVADKVRPQNVIDGVALVERFRGFLLALANQNPANSIYDFYTTSLTGTDTRTCAMVYNTDILAAYSGLPSFTSSACRALFVEIDRVANALDAVGDVLVAEGIFQGAKGNLDRVASTLESLTEGKNPPTPQVLDTPVTGPRVNHKLAAMMQAVASTGSYNPASFITYRSLAEPNLNKWVNDLLTAYTNDGAYMTHIACMASYPSGGSSVSHAVTLSSLSLTALDLLYLTQAGAYSGEMQTRITYYVRASYAQAVTTPISIDYKNMGTGGGIIASFQQLLPVLKAIADILGGSRWMKSSDFGNATVTAPVGAAYDLVELTTRYTNLRTALTSLGTSYFNALPVITDSNLATLKSRLFEAAYIGMGYAVPDTATELAASDAVTKLKTLAAKVKNDIASRLSVAAGFTTFSGSATEEQKVAGYAKGIAALLGDSFKVVPHFTFSNYAGLETSIHDQIANEVSTGPIPSPPPGGNLLQHARTLNLDFDLVMDDWLFGVSRVQEKTEYVETIRVLSKAAGHPLDQLRPVQFPYTSNDYWLGFEYPATYQPAEDRFSVALFNYSIIIPSGTLHYYSGLIIDEWSEVIPLAEQTTGLTFNYAQPNAKPPQNVLLAVNPQKNDGSTKPWKLEDLLHTLLDTIDMAQIRMVEPDDFTSVVASPPARSPFNPGSAPTSAEVNSTRKFDILKWMLPAIVGEVTPKDPANVNYQGEGAMQGVSFDYFANNVAPASSGGTTSGGSTHFGSTTHIDISGTLSEASSGTITLEGSGTGSSSGGGVLHASGFGTLPGGMEAHSLEELLSDPGVSAYIHKQAALSGVADLQQQLSSLIP